MSRSLLALLLAVFATIGGASAAMAHFGSEAAIIVPADYLLPGQQFDAVAVDLAPGSVVSFEMRRDALVVALGSAPSPGDGHFTLTMAVPADFPTGYAELVGTSSDGTSAMTWVLVGERNPATPAAPPGTVPWYADPSVVVLGALTFGALGAAAYVLLRRKNRPTILPKGR